MFKSTLIELWISSIFRDRIEIVNHNLDCVGAVREARFRDSINGKFDGVNMYGPSGKKAYTISLLQALKSAALCEERLSALEFFKKFCKEKINLKRKRSVSVDNNDGKVESVVNRDSVAAQEVYSIPVMNRYAPLNY